MSTGERIGWSLVVPTRPGLYWVRRPVPITADRYKHSVPCFSGYRPLLGGYEIVGVLVVALGPRGGKRAFRWCEPVRQKAKPARDWEYRWAGRPWLDDGIYATDEWHVRHGNAAVTEDRERT